MNFDLSRFDEYRENNRLDIKEASNELPASFLKTYCSFANTNGGIIILGPSENSDGSWSTTGLRKAGKLKKDLFGLLYDPAKASVNIVREPDIKIFHTPESKDQVITIKVPAAAPSQKPVYINEDLLKGTFRRNSEGDCQCNIHEIKAMLRDAAQPSMDTDILDDIPLSVLDHGTIERFRNRHRAHKPGDDLLKLPNEEYLIRIQVTGISKADNTVHPTRAGLLMFGEDWNIHRIFPDYFVDYRELTDPKTRYADRICSDTGEWSGNLFDFYFDVINKLSRLLTSPSSKAQGIRIADSDSVRKALQEALLNCIANTDFMLPQGMVITANYEQIQFQNPGSIRTGKVQMLHGGRSDPRNRAILNMFNLIGIDESAGCGIPYILSVWYNNHWPEPEFGETLNPDRTCLTLSLNKNMEIF